LGNCRAVLPQKQPRYDREKSLGRDASSYGSRCELRITRGLPILYATPVTRF